MFISINQIFKATAFILLGIALVIAASPLINVSDLQFPERLDSVSLSLGRQQMIKQLGGDSSKEQPLFYYNPEQLGLKYKKLSVRVDAETVLKCWLINEKGHQNAPLLVMLHDINESKISLLTAAKEFSDRGFNICLVDMRAHGESNGNCFTLGNLERYDIAKLVDTLIKRTNNQYITLMGFGMGANVALQSAVVNKNIRCLLLQSPTDSLSHYIKKYSQQKWGPLHTLFYPAMLRSLKKGVGFNIDTLAMSKVITRTKIPISIITGVRDEVIPINDSYRVFKKCTSTDKEYWPVRNADHFNIAEKAGVEYYNHLTYFINSSLPKPVVKKSRFKKLA